MGARAHISPLAPASPAKLPVVAGVTFATVAAGLRYRGRPDLMLALVEPGATVAGVFTRSRTRSAPVDWCRANLAEAARGGTARAIVVNAGNANAFTGKAGMRAVKATATAAARAAGCKPHEVYVASTGVIGEALDPAPIAAALPGLVAAARDDAGAEAAKAIMTTDTFPKVAFATARLGGKPITVCGFAKGSGMIAPDMATLLAFIFTDAALPQDVLQGLLARAVAPTFNCITVDGDTSTSDTLLCVATGAAGNRTGGLSDRSLAGFSGALDGVCRELALLVARDGEGAEKLVAITVTGAEDDGAARRIGMAIGNSPLVKTAIAGEDANWGRIVMAVGKSGERAERDRLAIRIGGISVARRGAADPAYREAALKPHMKGRDIDICVDVGVGRGRATVWTCDLTHRYIDINGSYRS